MPLLIQRPSTELGAAASLVLVKVTSGRGEEIPFPYRGKVGMGVVNLWIHLFWDSFHISGQDVKENCGTVAQRFFKSKLYFHVSPTSPAG